MNTVSRNVKFAIKNSRSEVPTILSELACRHLGEKSHLPLGNLLGRCALLREGVVDESKLAALLPRGDVVEADEELGTIVRVGVLGVGVELSELVRVGLFGAGEPASGL